MCNSLSQGSRQNCVPTCIKVHKNGAAGVTRQVIGIIAKLYSFLPPSAQGAEVKHGARKEEGKTLYQILVTGKKGRV